MVLLFSLLNLSCILILASSFHIYNMIEDENNAKIVILYFDKILSLLLYYFQFK